MSTPLKKKSSRYQRPPTAKEMRMNQKALAARLAAENRRAMFKQYVGNSGIMDCLTNVLLSLYEEKEKPQDALEYLYNKLSGIPLSMQQENLEEEKGQLEEKVDQLEAENQRLLERLQLYESRGDYEAPDYLGEGPPESKELGGEQ